MKTFKELFEKKMTPAELKKREEIAKAMERENPGMDMGKKMAIATAAAKCVAEEVDLDEATAFSSAMKKAVSAHERGDRKRAMYHLDNAKTARYTLKSTEMDKDPEMHKKYKEMRDKYSEKGGDFTIKHDMVGTAKVVKEAELDEAKTPEQKLQDIRDAIGLAREKRKMKGQRVQSQREIDLQKKHDDLSQQIRSKIVAEENQYMWKIEGGKGKGKGFGDKGTTVDDHLSAMNYHSGEYQKAMKEKRDSDSRHHGMKYHKHKDQIERLGDVGNYRKESVELDEAKSAADYEAIAKKHVADGQKGTRANMVYASKMAGRARRAAEILKKGGSQEDASKHYQGTVSEEAYMSSDRSKQIFKRKELDQELRHEVEPKRSEPADPHSVHINGKKWKTFADKNHATNVANKIKGATVVKESEELDEASDLHAQAMEHKKQSDAAMDKNDMEAYHHHMSEHHESMGQWHESNGRGSSAEKEYEKAEKHHELSLKKSNHKNEGTEMLSFKYFQEVLEEAKKKCKESSSELENAHDMKNVEDEIDERAPVAPVPGMKSKTHAIMVHPESKQRVRIERKNIKNYPVSDGWKEVGFGMKLKEEVEIEEALKGDMHPDATKVLKHIRPEHHDKYKPHLKSGVYKGNYADRSAVLRDAEKAGHTINEAVSPFDWKAYAKEKGTPSSNKTKTFHDVKKTSTGTVYTKQVNPDGTSKGSGDDAAQAAEKADAPKRGRGRPAGVGAKTGSYKPRDPAAKAASAAKAAASKAANRASRNEEFDNEFMGSLIEGFEDEDFDEFLYCEEFDELDEATQEALINFINEKCAYKMKESLTGGQKKLDKNKNGKLDGEDFKLLRKEETEQVQESVTAYAAFLNKK